MTLYIQRNSSENIAINKSLMTLKTLDGTLRDDTSIINPVMLIQCPLEDVALCNYMYVPEFGRSYFVTEIRSIRQGLVELSGHVDVLCSFRSEIRSNRGIVKKQQNVWNLYLDDGSFKTYQNPYVLTKAFPSGFTTQEFVLAVAGNG